MTEELKERRAVTGARALFLDFLFLGGANGVASLLALGAFALLARRFTPEELGHYNMVMIVVGAITLGTTWLMTAGTRYGREEYLQTHHIRKTFWGESLMVAGCLAFFFLAIVFFGHEIGDYLGLNGRTPRLMCLLSVAAALLPFWQNMFRATNNMKMFSMLPMLRNSIFLGALLIVVTTSGQLNVMKALELWMISSLAPGLLSFLLMKKHLYWPPHMEGAWTKSMIHYSWPLVLGAGTLYWSNSIDFVIVKAHLTAADLGYYAAAAACYRVLLVVPDLLSNTLLPVVVGFRMDKKAHLSEYYLKHTLPQLVALSSLGVIVTLVLAPAIILALYGNSYLESLPAMSLLIGASAFAALRKYLMPVIGAYDMTRAASVTGLAAAACITLLNLWLVPLLGIKGAAWAMLGTNWLESGCLLLFLSKKFTFRVRARWLVLYIGMPLAAMILSNHGTAWRLVFCGALTVFVVLFVKKIRLFRERDLQILEHLHAPKVVKVWGRKILQRWAGIHA